MRRLIKTPSPFLKEAFLSKFDTTWDIRDIHYHNTNFNIDGTSKFDTTWDIRDINYHKTNFNIDGTSKFSMVGVSMPRCVVMVI